MFLKKEFLFILLFFVSVNNSFSQRKPTPQQLEERMKDASQEDKFDAAKQLMEQKQWVHALVIWKNLISLYPDNANYNYLAGVCQLNMNLDKKDALPYLLKALPGISKTYDPFYFDETKASLETYFYLGKAYHLNYEFDKAIEYYNKFKSDGPKKHFLIADGEVDHQIKISNNAKVYMAESHEGEYKIYNIGGIINSEFSDFSPVVSLGEDILFFTSRRLRVDSANIDYLVPDDGKYFEDIYFSLAKGKDNFGKIIWSEPHLVGISNPDGNEATISASADGSQLFVYQDDNGDGNIYSTILEDTIFTELNKFIDVCSPAWETHLTMTPDGNTIYFVSDREGGLGGRDIYRLKKLPNGQWSKPMNLGAPINSKYDEDAPFIHADGVSLYFSANNDKSMGGFDIYLSQIDDDGKFSEPVNMGYPLNTVDDDVFFILNASGKRGYYSSAIAGGYGEKDIYVVEFDVVQVEPIAVLKGYIRPKKGEPFPDNILIYVTDLTEGGDPRVFKANALTESYILDLKPCHEYLIDYQRDEQTFYEFTTQVPCDAGIGNINHEIYIDPIYLDPEEAVVVEEKSRQWHIITTGQLPVGELTVSTIDENGKELFNDPVRDGYFKYREIPEGGKTLFLIKANDKPLCDELEIELISEDLKVIGKTVRDKNCKYIYQKDPVIISESKPTKFEKFYNYNQKDINKSNKEFKKFIDEVMDIIKARGKVDMTFESSASKVPTTTFVTNENLTLKRANDAKDRVMEALKSKGVDTKKVNIVAYSTLVQGPEFNDDWIENKETYEKFQYIKINAK